MQWTDEGLIIGTRRHGESSLIIELMTRGHGRHLGLVRGGRSRRQQPLLQPGNSVLATWRARLDEHLGNYVIEPVVQRAAKLMQAPAGLYGMQIVAGLLRLLPERDPHPSLFEGIGPMLDWLDDPLVGGAMIVRFELKMLEELGFGLELDQCAATGTTAELVFVSPKTGRAVSRVAGEAFRDRLLPLPAFLTDRAGSAAAAEVADAFRLTGHFLLRRVFEPRGLALPEARSRFLDLLARPVVAEAVAG
jgi:DNA repair protein RecO (recombination protein O)